MSHTILKEAFEVEAKHEPFYTGGNVQWSTDGQYIFCQKHGTVSVLSLKEGMSIVSHVGQSDNDEEKDVINTFTAFSNDVNIITHHKSGLFKLWNWKDKKLIKLWKSTHKGPVFHIAHCNETNLMVSGGSDGTVRLWDLQHHACTHNLKGVQGVISILAFHPNIEKKLVFAAGDDFKIHGWDITSGKEVVTLSGHFSKITSISFHTDGNSLVSSGRDRVLILWNISTASSVRVLPVYEEIEDTFILSKNVSLPVPLPKQNEDAIYIAAAGEKGIVKIWEMRSGREVYAQKNSILSAAKEGENLSITHLLSKNDGDTFAVVTVDHNILMYSLRTFECLKQLVGYSDEILDIVYLGDSQDHIAVATNSCDIKLYHVSTMNCQILCGHTDIVLALATTPANAWLLISSAKDNSIRIWLMDKETTKASCIASATRHTASVGSVAISQTSTKFFTSISQDLCLKLWNLPQDFESEDMHSVNVIHTVLAHQKDINSVTISPNDKLIATGSQDKTAKLWSSNDLQLLGVFHGHRRGVWCVRFSPIDQVLLTTSADCTIKLWSLTELNCLKTLEGHESSVLKAEFLTRGMQLITASGDGLLKLWSIKTSECLCTLEQHESRVWTIAVRKDEKTIISGGSDSLIVIWKDVTEERKEKIESDMKQLALEEQQLANLLKANKLSSALKMSLKLERPLQVLKIIESILKTGNCPLIPTISELQPVYKEKLLKCASTWNTNSKNCQVAQVVINALIVELKHEDFETSSTLMLESMIPYTERHYTRLTKLLQNLHLFTYTLNRIKPHIASTDSK
ncbi:transducin beta-like protein 3 [Hylaeus volcanicus]|uniref:transducin beta-like protein 3 n=1 Tax=Hylaeus volcanicus TaxID=313075 RepID=UPI0023B8275C|nr:transducin beta-like protein 3 [Hylaeus volcanicus]